MDTYINDMAVRRISIFHFAWDKGLKMLNLSDKSVSDIIKSEMSGVYYVATSGDKLYSNHHWKTIVSFDVVHKGR
jgi:hypothetical protein